MSLTTAIFSNLSEKSTTVPLCRLCMQKNHSNFNIFTSNVASQMTVEDALHDLIGLRVAMGDGLPDTVCPQCLKKLMEFCDFKKICFESDSELRTLSSRNYCRSIEEEKTADETSYAETKECIGDSSEGTSQFPCSVQRTEIYIPLEECQLPQEIMMNIKEEMVDDDNAGSCAENIECIQEMIEGTSPIACSAQTTEIFNPVQDCQLPRINIMPMFTEDGKPVDNSKKTDDSRTEATGLSTSGKTLLEKALTSCMLKERNARIDLSNDCVAPSVSVTHTQSATVESRAGEGGSVTDEELEEDSALHADKTRSNSIPDDGQSNVEHNPRYFCSACDQSFAHKCSLKCHMQRKHGVIDFYSCRICSETFTKIAHLTDHMHSHKGVKAFACNECTMSFSKKYILNLHTRKHSAEKPYSCKLCSRNYAHRSSLRAHMLVHSDVRPFSCNECAKAYYTKRDLVVHLRSHTGEKPYTCGKCNKRFSGNNVLKKHMRTHAKEFVCNHCGECFSRKDRYFVHMCSHAEETI
ncbi:zinc finger protein 2 homolog isoform X2 [Ischnura elegans]|uniref:zinc finger protein 2 homolog isoform X2 n=1 Tax=Ischnura elegans TaxID=197161 RepID=UPI001ED8AB85|nr:zinc finger protein 2 homolog isoform X2 [Ischnura elegans]